MDDEPKPPILRESIALVGYRATGKSSVARRLAERLGWRFVDADKEIERRAGAPIARIFEERGEPEFRDLEEQVVAEFAEGWRLVPGEKVEGRRDVKLLFAAAQEGFTKLATDHKGTPWEAVAKRSLAVLPGAHWEVLPR